MALEVALIGLGGVVLGATITGVWHLVLKRRDERSQLRAFARLATEDLDVRVRTLQAGTRSAYRGVRPVLEEHKLLFAERLPPDDWALVARALSDWDLEQSYHLAHADPNEWMKRNANLADSLRAAADVLRRHS